MLARMNETAESHLEDLREMGVEDGLAADWRREQLAGAVPLSELQQVGVFSFDDLLGADVRSTQDEYLGSMADVVLDPADGTPEFAIVARGGFLGVGEDHVIVPWAEMQGAPGLNAVVVELPEAEFERLPEIDPDIAADPDQFEQYREETDQVWEGHDAG